MKFRELEKAIALDGWRYVGAVGSHRQYKHPIKSGKVTIPFHGGRDIPTIVVKTILKQAQIHEVTK